MNWNSTDKLVQKESYSCYPPVDQAMHVVLCVQHVVLLDSTFKNFESRLSIVKHHWTNMFVLQIISACSKYSPCAEAEYHRLFAKVHLVLDKFLFLQALQQESREDRKAAVVV